MVNPMTQTMVQVPSRTTCSAVLENTYHQAAFTVWTLAVWGTLKMKPRMLHSKLSFGNLFQKIPSNIILIRRPLETTR
jgi:hypothetical protein